MLPFNFTDHWFWIVFAAFVAYSLFGVFRRGGVKAALFNARVAETLGELGATGPKLASQTLRVHSLDRDGVALVGIEVVSKTFASYEMLPIVLSPEAAKELSVLLERAVRSTGGRAAT
jgi:hypothetical protein